MIEFCTTTLWNTVPVPDISQKKYVGMRSIFLKTPQHHHLIVIQYIFLHVICKYKQISSKVLNEEIYILFFKERMMMRQSWCYIYVCLCSTPALFDVLQKMWVL